MNKKYTLDGESLLTMSSSVKEVLNIKSVSISILVALLGLAIIFLASFMDDKSASAYIALCTLATLLVIYGFYSLLSKRTLLIYLPTGSALLNGSLYFDQKDLDELKETFIKNQETDLSRYEFLKSGNSRLDYMVSKDGNFVAVQLYKYVPYTFEPACDIILYEATKAKNLGQFLLSTHGKI